MISGVEFEAIQPRESDIECIVMYGGGLTSYEAARIALKRYGHEAVEIWFADTRTEDEDLYRFNRDVEKLLDHEIIVFSQGLDIWGIFRRERFLGNSRIDPCSKFLKRAPLRRALEKRYPNRACVCCKEPWIKGGQTISVRDVDGTEIKEAICERCEVKDPKYSQSLNDLREIILVEGDGSQKSLIAMGRVQNRVERCSENGKFVRVVLGMDIIDDCDRLHRAKSYWRPFVNWFPLIEPPFGNKSRIIKELRSAGVREPRLYGAGFVHNNCGGFCVKAGKGQMAHLLNTLPERYLEHEKKELEFQDFIGSDVTILSEMRGGVRRNLTLRELRERVEAGEDFRYDQGTACACLNPLNPEVNEIAW